MKKNIIFKILGVLFYAIDLNVILEDVLFKIPC